jgi:tRNA-specific 2-thiouridylase
MAKKFKISRFIKGESQDVCFVGNSINDFLKKNIKSKSGQIIDDKGRVIGKHQGLCFYTFGQRKGLKIGGTSKPLYVIDKNTRRNVLIVSQNPGDLEKKDLICGKVNWISGKKPKMPLRVKVKIRYRHKSTSAIIKPYGRTAIKVVFDKPQRAITPGQSVVFYSGQQLLGGGIIT